MFSRKKGKGKKKGQGGIYKERKLRRFFKYAIISVTFSTIASFAVSIYFKDLAMFYAALITAASYITMLLVYILVFIKKRLPISTAEKFIYICSIVILTILIYISGGYTGPLVPTIFMIIIIFARFAEEKKAIKLTIIMIGIYIAFFLLEEIGVFRSYPMKDPITIKYSRAIIDIVIFIIMGLMVVDLSKEFKDSIRFYRLRSIRLAKIRKRLEVLVDRRTKELKQKTRQLEKSNTRLRKTQSELKKSNKELKELDKKKNAFISITSHELQTPMTSIRGFSQLLLEKTNIANSPKKRKKYLKIIQSESDRLSKLVRDMLDLSRIDLGTMKFNIETFDVAELIKDIKIQMEQKAKSKGLKIILKIPKELPKMETDKEKLTQILLNLVSNAIKYTNKGSITIEAKKQSKSIQFSVTDTGIGIQKKEYKKIYGRFYQANYSYERKASGAGLGLSICKEFVELMGGKIWLTSKVGKGTTFYFTLPIKFKPPRKTKKSKSKPKSRSKSRRKAKKV